MVVENFCLINQHSMATMNEEMVNVDTRENVEEEKYPGKMGSIDSEEETSESKNRVQRFDMVLKHLHRLKSQMNNNNDNGIHPSQMEPSENVSKSSSSIPSNFKNKAEEEFKKDETLGNIEEEEIEDTMAEERPSRTFDDINPQKESAALSSPIPPAFKELHKLQALKLLQQQTQQRGNYQIKEQDRKQLPHQRFPQHYGGPLSHHPSHRHSPPLSLKLPPPMRHPFFNHHHPQPINQPNNHYYSSSNNPVRNFPQPGYFSPPLSQRLSGQNNRTTSPAFPPVHQGNSASNYPMPPPPLTRFPMPPGLMRALAPNLANLAPHMIQPLLDEAKNRLAVMHARMGNEDPQLPPMYPTSNSISESPSSPPSNRHQGNKFSSLFPPMMKDVSMDWNNPMLSSTAGFKSPNPSNIQSTPLKGCSTSFTSNKDTRSTKDVALTGNRDRDASGQINLGNDFSGLEESFLTPNQDGRLVFTEDEDEEDEIFLEEDVGVDDDDEEEELDNLGVNVESLNEIEEIGKETSTKEQNVGQFERKIGKLNENVASTSGENDRNDIVTRKRKRASFNDIDETNTPRDENIDESNKKSITKDQITENDNEKTADNFMRNVGKSKRMRSGSASPPPSTGGLSPPLQDSPGTPPLQSDGRMFPPPFAYKLLEVRTFTYFHVAISSMSFIN